MSADGTTAPVDKTPANADDDPGSQAPTAGDEPLGGPEPAASSAPSRETQSEPSTFLGRIRSLLGGAPARRNADEIFAALENGRRDAVEDMPRGRREMIERVIAFDEKRVVDVMTPRADIMALDVTTPMPELIELFAKAGHSRMPLYRGDLDNPIGVAHIKDVVSLLANPVEAGDDADPVLKRICRDLLYVPPSMRITDLLLRMQASRIHMALVIDEFGGVDGLVTIEDLIEEIVGDINDEHDEDEAPMVSLRTGGGWEADARVELDEFIEATGVDIQRADEDQEIDTLGGLVFSLAGRVPQRGEVLTHASGLEFEIMEADARKIRKILIRRRPGGPADVLAKAAE